MNTKLKYAAIGTAGLILGYGAGYVIANKKASKLIDKGFAEITEKYEDALARIQKSGPYSTVDEAAAVLIPDETQELDFPEADEEDISDELAESEESPKHLFKDYEDRMDEYGRVTFPGTEDLPQEDEEPEEEEELPSGEVEDEYDNSPESSTPEFVTVRDPNGPYVISIDEYMDDDSPYAKVEMTFFEGDDTLLDSRESIVPDIDGVVGLKNLSKWGTGTTDKDQVYIRNERLEMDIELTRDEQTYTRAVLGIIPAEEVQRSMIKPLKMRDGDGD